MIVYCPKCGEESAIEIKVLKPEPHAPLFQCPQCLTQWRIAFHEIEAAP